MIDLQEIEDEITRLEHGNTTYASCEKLSVLYTVRNQLGEPTPKIDKNAYSFASESEFVSLARSVPFDDLINVLDEHMEAIKMIYPKEYASIIRKIRS